MKDDFTLPNDTQAEVWLLGGILQDGRVMVQFAAGLAEDDFYWEKHGKIWAAMQRLHKDGKPIDIITLASELGKMDSLKTAGGREYLFAISEAVPSSASVDYYIEIIKGLSAKRKLYHSCQKAISNILDNATTANECLESMLETLTGIAKRSHGVKVKPIGDIANRFISDIESMQAQGKMPGMKTGFKELDYLTEGLKKNELVIIGARPGVGKTSFALKIAINIAQRVGPVLMFSLEMSEAQLAARSLCFQSKINLKRTIGANLTKSEISQQKNAATFFENIPLSIIDERDLTARQISAIAHAYAAKFPPVLIIIDHMQIVNTNADRKNYENRNVAIGEASRLFKVLSGKLNCNVMVLSQLNRDIEKGGFKPPKLSDLRDSGTIEQDADCVVLMHRLTKAGDNRDCTDTDLIIAKNRSGPTGETKIHFNPGNAMFTNPDEYCFVE